ncbi:hypothetical protein F5144DRAFT_353885 [Chaetomium tenue]|uniref:Uncharacterized protein n=1 Tax=Chaetomium tenue TaxID=1854479 RepID=A0ACB7P3C7_9PEZI|nr:hypothetical protein F5144DRAFT_353885 [Chaetomium globosum]
MPVSEIDVPGLFLGVEDGEEPSLPIRIGVPSGPHSDFEPHHVPTTRARTNRGNIVSVPHAWTTTSHVFGFLLTSPRKSSPWSRRKPSGQTGPSTPTRFPTKAPSPIDSTRSPRRFTGESVDHLQPHRSPSRRRQGEVRHLLPCLTFAHSPRVSCLGESTTARTTASRSAGFAVEAEVCVRVPASLLGHMMLWLQRMEAAPVEARSKHLQSRDRLVASLAYEVLGAKSSLTQPGAK